VEALAEAVSVQAQQLGDHERHRGGGPRLHRIGTWRVGGAVTGLALRASDKLGQPLPAEAVRRCVLAVAAQAGDDQ